MRSFIFLVVVLVGCGSDVGSDPRLEYRALATEEATPVPSIEEYSTEGEWLDLDGTFFYAYYRAVLVLWYERDSNEFHGVVRTRSGGTARDITIDVSLSNGMALETKRIKRLNTKTEKPLFIIIEVPDEPFTSWTARLRSRKD